MAGRRASEPPKPIPGLAKSPNTLKALVEEDKIMRQNADSINRLVMSNGIASKSPSNEVIKEEDEEEAEQ